MSGFSVLRSGFDVTIVLCCVATPTLSELRSTFRSGKCNASRVLRKWESSVRNVYVHTRSRVEIQKLEHDQPRHDRPAAHCIAQQYSSAFFVSLRFCFHKENYSAPFKSIIFLFWGQHPPPPPPLQWVRATLFTNIIYDTQRRNIVGRTPLDE